VVAGGGKHLDHSHAAELRVQLMSAEAVPTSEIEGDIPDRAKGAIIHPAGEEGVAETLRC
jgi:hypothetical protein